MNGWTLTGTGWRYDDTRFPIELRCQIRAGARPWTARNGATWLCGKKRYRRGRPVSGILRTFATAEAAAAAALAEWLATNT